MLNHEMIWGYDLYNATLLSEYVIQFVICFSLMFIVDKCFAPMSARWYFLHVFMNGLIVYFTWPDVMFCLMHPKSCYAVDQHLSNTMGWMAGLSGHVYHMLMFDDLRYDDYMHHILMFPFAGLAGLMALRKPGFNFAIFALTGLPGGIDFVLLTLVKLGYIDRYTEKRLNVYIQIWFRAPLLIFNCGIFYAELFEGHISPWCLIGVGLSFWNGIHYAHEVLASYYHKHHDHVLNMSKNKITCGVPTDGVSQIVIERKPIIVETLVDESTEEPMDDCRTSSKTDDDATEESNVKSYNDDESLDAPPVPPVSEESIEESSDE